MTSRENREAIQRLTKTSGMGGRNNATTNALKSLDYLGTGGGRAPNRNTQGMVLFSRPRMNMSYDNLSGLRIMHDLLTDNDLSIEMYIRNMLDPTLPTRYGKRSKLMDNGSAFINVLTNTCSELPGFPDRTSDTYTSPEGDMKEKWSMVDGTWEIMDAPDLTATFDNIAGDVIGKLFNYWAIYPNAVYLNDLAPYTEMIDENEIDYQTAIWRLLFNDRSTHVTGIARCIAFPIADASGAKFNYTRESVLVQDTDTISIPFRANGIDYDDPILYTEFNLLVSIFNPLMGDSVRENQMVKLTHAESVYLCSESFTTFPHIDPLTKEITWWMRPGDYYTAMGIADPSAAR